VKMPLKTFALLLTISGNLRADAPEKFLFSGSNGQQNRQIFVVSDEGTGQQQLTNFPNGATCPQWSPNRHEFACLAGKGIAILDDRGTIKTEFGRKGEAIQHFCWVERGHSIIYVARNKSPFYSEVVLRNLSNGDERILRKESFVSDLSVSPNNKYLAFVLDDSEENEQVEIFDFQSQKQIFHTNSRTPASQMMKDGAGNLLDTVISELQWSPDSGTLAYAVMDQNHHMKIIHILNAQVIDLGELGDQYVAWSPDGNLMAMSNAEDPGIFVIESNSSSRRRITPVGFYASDQIYSNDSKFIAYLSTGPEKSIGEGTAIYEAKADGTEAKRISSYMIEGDAEQFSWSKAIARTK